MFSGKPKIQLEMLETSSKVSLKLSSLKACSNDISQAERLYSFITSDIQELPDFDPVKPSGIEAVKTQLSDFFGWMNSHKEDIEQGVNLFNSIRSRMANATQVASQTIPSDIPPIPKV